MHRPERLHAAMAHASADAKSVPAALFAALFPALHGASTSNIPVVFVSVVDPDWLRTRGKHVSASRSSVVIAIVLEHHCLKEDVCQIDVGVSVHDLDNAAWSIFGKIGQRRDNVGPTYLVHDILVQNFLFLRCHSRQIRDLKSQNTKAVASRRAQGRHTRPGLSQAV
jgi:hypothetical protein